MNGMIVGQFSTSYPSCKGPNTATHDQEVDETQATEDTQHETIDCVITKEGVVSAIKKLKSRKAPSPDGIPVEALKCFTDRMCDTLSVIFNKDVQIKHTFPQE